MSISFESDKVILEKLRERLRRMCIHWKQQRPRDGFGNRCASVGNSSGPATVRKPPPRIKVSQVGQQGNGKSHRYS